MQHGRSLSHREPPAAIPPTSEIFDKHQIVQRHPTLLSAQRIEWALRKRSENGLGDAVFETRGGQLYIHEPAFLAWFLGLAGRHKPRAGRRAA
jgi:hypothetical protein